MKHNLKEPPRKNKELKHIHTKPSWRQEKLAIIHVWKKNPKLKNKIRKPQVTYM
jgi:hypothetical protein